MPFSKEPSVVQWKGCDCWRTWFIDDCEKSGLFGVNKKHLGIVTLRGVRVADTRIRAYDNGTLVYLEDAPYFHTSKKQHCICGPYVVQTAHRANLNEGQTVEYETSDGVVLWHDLNAKNGPWLDNAYIRREIHNLDCRYSKIASEFNYFPYRFIIKRHQKYQSILTPHNREICRLCD